MAINELLDAIEWTPTNMQGDDSGLPWATHTGVLKIGDFEMRVHQLNTGQRVVDAEDLEAWGNFLTKGGGDDC